MAGMAGARSIGLSAAMPLESALAATLSFVNTFLGTGALCWLGLWFGLTARRQTSAILYAVCLAQGVPWLASLAGLILSATVIGPFGHSLPVPYAVISWMPEAAIALFYIWLLWLARRGLAGKLAGVAQVPFNLERLTQWVGTS
jgi:hypothetical protein